MSIEIKRPSPFTVLEKAGDANEAAAKAAKLALEEAEKQRVAKVDQITAEADAGYQEIDASYSAQVIEAEQPYDAKQEEIKKLRAQLEKAEADAKALLAQEDARVAQINAACSQRSQDLTAQAQQKKDVANDEFAQVTQEQKGLQKKTRAAGRGALLAEFNALVEWTVYTPVNGAAKISSGIANIFRNISTSYAEGREKGSLPVPDALKGHVVEKFNLVPGPKL